MAVIYTPHFIQFFDDDGAPLAGGKLYTYEAGTTTPKATYTTAGAGSPNANPVVLDSQGRAVIFLSGSYKFYLTDSSDVAVGPNGGITDNITAFQASSSGAIADGDYGDITVSSSGTVMTIDNNAVTTSKISDANVSLAKLSTQAANTVLANATASAASPTAVALNASELLGRGSTGNVSAITLGTGLSMSGAVLSSTGSDASTEFDQIFDMNYAVASQTTSAVVASEVYVDMTGTSSSVQFPATSGDNARGTATCSTGTTTTGRAGIYAMCDTSGQGSFTPTGTGAFIFEARVKLTTLSDGTNTYICAVGSNQGVHSAFPGNNGYYFRYTHGTNSGKWQAVTDTGSLQTSTDTGVIADTSYAIFRIEVNAANTSVAFYINNTLVATNTTNIPSSSSICNIGAGLLKSAGTTARTIEVDYLRIKCSTR